MQVFIVYLSNEQMSCSETENRMCAYAVPLVVLISKYLLQ